MKVAIVHDFLSQTGGAERVVLQLAAMFEDAPIFTSFYAPEGTYPEFRDLDVRVSPLAESVSPDQFRRNVLLFPKVFASMNLEEFDAVLISTSAFAHHVRHHRSVVYCHTPPRYLYDPATYTKRRITSAMLAAAFAWQRPADRRAARNHRHYLANSELTRDRILRCYGREATVLHPPLWLDHLPEEFSPVPENPKVLVVSRLLPYKRVDLAVEACRRAGVGLTVVGDGPERARLEALGTGATFLGRVSDNELRRLFGEHALVLVSGAEDFGYLPVEANYAGLPVVARAEGGNLETVESGVTGILVDSDDPERWALAVAEAVGKQWDRNALRQRSMRYHPSTFAAELRTYLDRAQ